MWNAARVAPISTARMAGAQGLHQGLRLGGQRTGGKFQGPPRSVLKVPSTKCIDHR
jgi:hypothetical protein